MANHAFCIHGHFYQPPREDPLTGEIPMESGAAPFQNWNERIHDQCYKPNADLGNFEHISFNVGPTLFEWMEDHHPVTVAQIIQQERRNVEKYGVGNAMAQAYNHTILPLSSKQDKITQIVWGIGDFVHRFGHRPNGMWLPEAAVDLETLSTLAECGIEFTILAPWQAAESGLDVSIPYRVALPDGKEIVVFFYEEELSMRVSFEAEATTNADAFVAQTLSTRYRPKRQKTGKEQMLIIASDGELYGHHKTFRDKFLAYLVDGALKGKKLKKTFPALWLKQHPATKYARINENTSWSCHHGIKLWSDVCLCTPHAEWKEPLRTALNKIAIDMDIEYVRVISHYLPDDPWQLRHNYISVLIGELDEAEYVRREIRQNLTGEEVETICLLLKAQYERQRMFTSCGWFFDDFDRIEPRNNVAYAAQAVWLMALATGRDISEQASEWMKAVKSWRSDLRADAVFDRHLQRARDAAPGKELVHQADF